MYFLRKSSKGVVPFSSALCRVPVCAIFLPLYSCVSRFFFSVPVLVPCCSSSVVPAIVNLCL